jgi:hypothetical protein
MAIDASIYGQIRQPEAFNPLAEMAQFQQVQAAQNQNKLAALGFQDRERAINDANAQREAVRGFGQDTAANYQSLLKTGNLTAAQDYQKKIQDQQKTASEISAKDFETASKRLDVAGQAFGFVRANPTLENAVSTIGYLERNGILSPEQAKQYRQTVEASPQAIGQLAEQAFRSTLDAKDQLGQIKVTNLGGTSQTTSVDPVTSRVTVLADTPITQSADNKASVGASMANAAAIREAAKEQAGATRAAANTQRDQATEMKLADDYRAQSKEFSASKSAHEQLKATLGSATTSPAATLAAATKFMKILDPGSVVRESELGMALAASGVIDRAMNYISTLQSGQKLTPTQAADFKKISNDMFQAAQRVQQQIDKDYQGKAKAYGLRPEMVTQDLGQNANITSWESLKK